MDDIVFVALIVAFFAASAGLVRFCAAPDGPEGAGHELGLLDERASPRW